MATAVPLPRGLLAIDLWQRHLMLQARQFICEERWLNSLGIAVSGLPFQGQIPLRAGCVPQDHCLPAQAHSCRLHKASAMVSA